MLSIKTWPRLSELSRGSLGFYFRFVLADLCIHPISSLGYVTEPQETKRPRTETLLPNPTGHSPIRHPGTLYYLARSLNSLGLSSSGGGRMLSFRVSWDRPCSYLNNVVVRPTLSCFVFIELPVGRPSKAPQRRSGSHKVSYRGRRSAPCFVISHSSPTLSSSVCSGR